MHSLKKNKIHDLMKLNPLKHLSYDRDHRDGPMSNIWSINLHMCIYWCRSHRVKIVRRRIYQTSRTDIHIKNICFTEICQTHQLWFMKLSNNCQTTSDEIIVLTRK